VLAGRKALQAGTSGFHRPLGKGEGIHKHIAGQLHGVDLVERDRSVRRGSGEGHCVHFDPPRRLRAWTEDRTKREHVARSVLFLTLIG